MDNFNVCKDKQPDTYYVDDYNTLIVVAKSIDQFSASHVRRCLIRIQPGDTSKSQILRIIFESFYITSCDVNLKIEESLFQTFDKDVTLLVSTCSNTVIPD